MIANTTGTSEYTKRSTANTGRLNGLHKLGQSYWLDNLTREMLRNGDLKARIELEGLRGITSNPKTFSDSVRTGTLYGEDIELLVSRGRDDESIYETLMVDDVRCACGIFEPIYNESSGLDGYVSIEVDPRLARDTQGTLNAARDLWGKVGQPNVMIKIPATDAALPAIEEALYEGINVNITLIFSVSRYREVSACYHRALRRREREGLEIGKLASVASFFLSRIDAKVDKQLEIAAVTPGETDIVDSVKGKAAVALARAAYADYLNIYSDQSNWKSLKEKGALPQRLLWASTSVKDDTYPDTYYVDSLIAKGTINTMPEKTAQAFDKHGNLNAVAGDEGELEGITQNLTSLGVDLEAVAAELEEEGIQKFVEPFERGLRTVERQAKQVRGDAV